LLFLAAVAYGFAYTRRGATSRSHFHLAVFYRYEHPHIG